MRALVILSKDIIQTSETIYGNVKRKMHCSSTVFFMKTKDNSTYDLSLWDFDTKICVNLNCSHTIRCNVRYKPVNTEKGSKS